MLCFKTLADENTGVFLAQLSSDDNKMKLTAFKVGYFQAFPVILYDLSTFLLPIVTDTRNQYFTDACIRYGPSLFGEHKVFLNIQHIKCVSPLILTSFYRALLKARCATCFAVMILSYYLSPYKDFANCYYLEEWSTIRYNFN